MGRNRTTGGTTLLLLIWFVWEVHRPDKNQLFPRTNYPNSRWAVQNVQCSGECLSLYVRKATQPLQKHVAQCSKARKDSAAHLHLKEKGHEDTLHILNQEDQCFDRGVKETSLSSINDHQWTVLWYPWHQLAATIAQSCDSFQSNWTSLYTLTHVTLLTDTMTAYVTDSQHYLQGDNSTWY